MIWIEIIVCTSFVGFLQMEIMESIREIITATYFLPLTKTIMKGVAAIKGDLLQIIIIPAIECYTTITLHTEI